MTTDYQAARAAAEAEEALRITEGLESGDLFAVSWSDLLTCVEGLRVSIAQIDLTPDDDDAMYMALLHTTNKADTLTRLLTALTTDASPHSREKRREAHEKREAARKTTGAA